MSSIISNTYYSSDFDENREVIKENVLTNVLNFLGYIPIISTISGLVRVIFATINLITSDDDRTFHYFCHLIRGLIEIIPVAGNLTMKICDVSFTFYLKDKENNIVVPDLSKQKMYKL